ncbi:ribonuclease H-like protein [Dothidotthia symphoricarpi CBS 119687]|uniref:Ribonuclease H-like protein n=1 Tax=Dothidotthia symphoricarpi CBS 119687 TaxID=1392245 RepID=A0A6A6A511_9PLEO|nr:ribonuclease H-like protein [Dothidotthia symphoricarpi CBS 119687]KAF2127082.1 ribonuclease H-like protein [Dothidotthia symphoricarpi CBS 119687]
MGIKNLAYCVASVSYPGASDHGAKWSAVMDVEQWEKIDLLGARKVVPLTSSPRDVAGAGNENEDVDVNEEEDVDADENQDVGVDVNVDVEGETDPFSPSNLSLTAYHLVTQTILTAKPDIILIEKQRWRSGGGHAVLQWTVRVNTLEAILWAVLTSVKAERALQDPKAKGFTVWGVDPKRVGQFWLGVHSQQTESAAAETVSTEPIKTKPISAEPISPEPITAEDETTPAGDEATKPSRPKAKKPNRSKAEKRAKISLLRGWLTTTPSSTGSLTRSSSASSPRIHFQIGHKASATRDALAFPGQKSLSGTGQIRDAELKKLDDVADCFLQAAAWVAWESNRMQLVDVLARVEGEGEDADTEVEVEEEVVDGALSKKVVLAMVDEVGDV